MEPGATDPLLHLGPDLFTGGPVVVFRWRATEGWPVEFVSPNVEELFGYPASAFLSGAVAYASVVHPDDIGRVADEVRRHADSHEVRFEQDYRVVRSDGEVRWLYDQTRVVRDPDGRVTHFLGYVLDVTERRRTQEALANARRMEALGRLASGIAHDFNNLLTAIAGHLDLAAQRLAEEDPARHSLQIARRTVDRGGALTAQLLALSRPAAPPRPAALDTVVRETLDLLAPLLGEDVTVAADLAAPNGQVAMDAVQLQQVLMNLALNARDAMPSGGRLGVRTEIAGGRCRLSVSDSGVGMDEATVGRIFEPFFSTRAGGTGLGLSTVASLVEAADGWVRVESAPGRGTTFVVGLPAAAAVPPPPPPQPRAAPSAARVLVVEDHADIRELLAEILAANGHTVRAVANGDLALAAFRDGFVPELLVTDVSMPGRGGVDLCRALEQRGWAGPVLFVSGHVRDLEPELPRGGRRALLRKPFGVDTLLRQVAALLERPPPTR